MCFWKVRNASAARGRAAQPRCDCAPRCNASPLRVRQLSGEADLVAAMFARLDLVTRHEFDVQTELLARTREKLSKHTQPR